MQPFEGGISVIDEETRALRGYENFSEDRQLGVVPGFEPACLKVMFSPPPLPSHLPPVLTVVITHCPSSTRSP